MAIDEGGPAFPDPIRAHSRTSPTGMSLRDYYAAKAMQAIFANWEAVCAISQEAGSDAGLNHRVARRAYEIADAMIEARKQSK